MEKDVTYLSQAYWEEHYAYFEKAFAQVMTVGSLLKLPWDQAPLGREKSLVSHFSMGLTADRNVQT